LLDLLINKTVEVTIEKEIIKSNSIIVDATHTKARFKQKSPKELFAEKSKQLRKSIYQVDFPVKNQTDGLEEELDYCQKLMDVIEKDKIIREYPKEKS